MMGYISFSSKSLIIINFFILLASFLHALGDSAVKPKRETLEIIIGGGGIGIGGGGNCNTQDCPPPPSPPPNTECPQPPKPHIGPEPLFFADERLAVVYPVIQKFKNFITSDPLGITKTWEGSDICNKYKGFFCGNPPDNKTASGLASIDFNGYRLGAPSLEGFLDQLPDLALFHANSNNFSGTISSKITKLRYLYELDISNNKFSGQFPTAVLGMKGLTFLDIRFNFFGGYLPAQLFTQPIIDVIFVNNNNFKQKLPDNLGNTTAHYLTFANNKFVGSIPRSIRKASATLIEVLFLNNQLSGCLPYEIGFLKETTVFDAGQNCLTGPIPCSFGCLEKMELLNFAGNQLYGQIPEVVCALGNLANLSLSDNYFTEVGPMCRKLIKRGVLDVRKNCIHDGASQRSEAECAAFFSYPRSCPYEASYSLIPCKLPHFSQKTSPRSSRPSPSYSALTRHRS